MVLLTPLVLTTLLMIFAFAFNQRRSKKELEFELIPNCLLTRYPVLFISGYQSPFYFSKYWNEFPAFLTEHGYEVYSFNLPWRKDQSRIDQLTLALLNWAEKNRHFHLFISPESLPLIQEIFLGLEGPRARQVFLSITICVDKEKDVTHYLPQRELKSFPVAIESLEFATVKRPSFSTRMFWRIHQTWTRSPRYELTSVGADFSLQNCTLLLERAKLLAERDLTKNP